jgi:tetraacyldisaccharide 4'-kinase
LCTKALEPLAKVYEFIGRIRANSITPEKVRVPVICVGNVVLGGAGKTPTVELVCSILKKHSFNPHILIGGYGGYLKNVVRVDVNKHSYLQVGDEALLSATVCPTWVGRNRVNSADAAILSGATVLVMDDGFQNNSIHKNFKILVIDSGQKFGNGLVFPVGPLSESVSSGIKKSNIVFIIGNRNHALEEEILAVQEKMPIFYASMDVCQKNGIDQNDKVIGFCGLGYPAKFKKSLDSLGVEVIDFVAFSDHHPYTITEIQKLIRTSKNTGSKLVTTRKDYIKIPDVFKSEIYVVDIKLSLADESFENVLIERISCASSN